jgi:hypothetical protein
MQNRTAQICWRAKRPPPLHYQTGKSGPTPPPSCKNKLFPDSALFFGVVSAASRRLGGCRRSLRGRSFYRVFSAGARLWHALRGVIKESLFGDTITLPSLVRQLIHGHERAVVQLEVEVPADDHEIAVHKDRADAFRGQRLEPRQEAALVRDVGIAPDSRLALPVRLATRLPLRSRS